VFTGLPDSAELVWHSLLMPFSSSLWMALLLSLLALSTLLWLTTKLSHRYGSEFDGKEPKFSFLQSVFCAFSAFCSEGKKTVFLPRNKIILVNKVGIGLSSKPCVTFHNTLSLRREVDISTPNPQYVEAVSFIRNLRKRPVVVTKGPFMRGVRGKLHNEKFHNLYSFRNIIIIIIIISNNLEYFTIYICFAFITHVS
jgi:hypothetical protein